MYMYVDEKRERDVLLSFARARLYGFDSADALLHFRHVGKLGRSLVIFFWFNEYPNIRGRGFVSRRRSRIRCGG